MDRRTFIGAGAAACAAIAAPARAASGDAALNALAERIFEAKLGTEPELASELGLDEGPRAALRSRLNDYSKGGEAAKLATARQWLGEARRVDPASLSRRGRINREVMIHLLRTQVDGRGRHRFGTIGDQYFPYAISQQNGPYCTIPDFLDSVHRVEDHDDAEAYLARLDAFGPAIDDNSRFQEEDAAAAVFAPDFCLDLALDQMRRMRGEAAERTPLAASIARRSHDLKLDGTFGERAARIVERRVFPALDRQIELVARLRAKATHDAGVWRLPGGRDYYADALNHAATTTLAPDDVHETGAEQVREISDELNRALREQGLTQGTVGERLVALGRDPRQLYPNTDEGRAQLLAYLGAIEKRMEAALPAAFHQLPRQPLDIRRVPPATDAHAASGHYEAGSLDGRRGPTYYINLRDTAEWPRFALATLTHHEGVPGHHVQLSLARAASDVPVLLRQTSFGAYSEGWALYAQQLAGEMGLFSDDPLGRIGYLQSSLLRAVRLVADTGLHFHEWSREKAVAYLADTTGYARSRAEREINRYVICPAQACTYKIGQIAWLRTREKVRALRGSGFDLRQFHDVLTEGALPLAILEELALGQARAA